MAFEIPGKMIGTEVANEDLTTHQYKAVVFAEYGVELAAADEASIGILQNAPDVDQAAGVMVDGVSKIVAGAAFQAGDDLMVGTSGKLIKATSGKPIVAKALETCTADGDRVGAQIVYKGLV